MADQRENDLYPTGLGLSFDGELNASEPQQHDAFQGLREVEDSNDESFDDFDRDFTNDAEHRTESLRVTVDHAPAGAHEVGSQPGSAFSPSSSEGDEDAEDEVEEQDENNNDFEQAEEWHDVEIHNPYPQPPVEQYLVYPAISGSTDGDEIDHIYRVDPRSGRCSPLHREKGQNRYGFREKMNEYTPRPSKRQKILTSPPVSPNNNTGMPADMGVTPEPSPEAEEDDHAVSPLSQHEASEPALEQHSSTNKRVWSEEDEEDTSWVSVAIADVTGSRRGSAESITADFPEHDTGSANVPESSDDAANALSPVSPIDRDGALNALRDDSDRNEEDTTATSPEASEQYPDSSQESATVTIVVDPAVDLPPSHMRDPTSPDPAGPERLTGLTPEEGIDIWWQWHDRLEKPSFNTNRNPFNQDKSGDFKYAIDSSGRDEAADVLSKRRFILNRLTSRDVVCISDTMGDVERTLEHMRTQMLKYRHQRNEYRLDREFLEGKIGRRDETIQEMDGRITRRDNTIREQEDRIREKQEELDETQEVVSQAVEDARYFGAQKEKAVEAAKAMRAQKETAVEAVEAMRVEKEKLAKMLEQKIDEAQRELGSRKQPLQFGSIMTVISQAPVAGEASDPLRHESQLQSRIDDLTRQLSESQASRATLDETCTALHGRIAELEQALAEQDQRAEIKRLEADNVAWQVYADESIARIQAELDAAHEEASGLKDALLEHGWSAYAPSRKHTMPLMSDQGTQTETRVSSALPRSPAKAAPAPSRATKKQPQPTHEKVSNQPSNWADRRKAIMQSPSAVEELEVRRVARKKRQAVELERLDQFRQSMETFLNLDELPHFPMEAGRVAVAV
jgi:hypothetical protein